MLLAQVYTSNTLNTYNETATFPEYIQHFVQIQKFYVFCYLNIAK